MAKMTTCKSCGKEVASSAKACPNCGASLKMGFGKKVLIVIGVLFALGIIGSLAGGEDTNTPSSSSNTPSSSPNVQQAAQPTILSNEGVSSDVKIVVNGMETKNTIGNNQYSTATAQGVFKVITISLTNNQKDAITVDSNSFKLVDDKGREFSYSSEAQMALMSSIGGKDESLFLKKINPGLSVTGKVAFDVPQDAKGLVLKARGGMTGKEITLKVE